MNHIHSSLNCIQQFHPKSFPKRHFSSTSWTSYMLNSIVNLVICTSSPTNASQEGIHSTQWSCTLHPVKKLNLFCFFPTRCIGLSGCWTHRAHSRISHFLLLQVKQNCASYIYLSETLRFLAFVARDSGSCCPPWYNFCAFGNPPVLE